MVLSLDLQERYRQRYAAMRPGWLPGSHVYRDLVTASLSPAVRLLDLGCGRGGVIERLHNKAGFATGLDPDEDSLREHRQPAISLALGSADTLPYCDATFDLVCSSWVLEHLGQPAQVFGEVGRVLREDGKFIFLTPNVRHPLLMLNRWMRWMSARLVDRIYGRAEEDVFPAYYRANSVRRIEALAREAGLERRSLRLIGDPSYLAFNEALFRIACVLERVTPAGMRVHIVGEYARQ